MTFHLQFIIQHLKFFFVAFFVFTTSFSFSQKAVPDLWNQRVHDEAHVLKPETVDLLEKELKAFEDSTTNQIAILIVQSLDGDIVEEYSLRVAEAWQLGQKDKDNGALLLVAIDDHKMRIEVGHGLEGVLTDAQSNRIIRNEMAPNFRRGDYDAGVVAAVHGMIKSIGGEYKADDIDPASDDFDLGEKILFGTFIFAILGLFTAGAIFSQGCAGWGLYAFLIPFYACFPWVVLGYTGAGILLVIYIIGAPIAKILIGRSKWGKAFFAKQKTKYSSGSSGGSKGSSWSSGGSSWSSGSSSWGGGSSFSGGGGSFGGGGSSGSW